MADLPFVPTGCDCDACDGDHSSRCAIYVQPAPVEGRTPSPGPWCPVCRQPVPETGMAWTFPPHGDGCEGSGRKVRDRDHGFVVDGRVLPEWECVTAPARTKT